MSAKKRTSSRKRKTAQKKFGEWQPEALGMDLTEPKAMKRWLELLEWVCADICDGDAHLLPLAVVAPSHWAPKNDAEKAEVRILSRILRAETSESAKSALGEDLPLEKVFNLDDDEAIEARKFAIKNLPRKIGGTNLQQLLYAWKYYTFHHHDEESKKLLASLEEIRRSGTHATKLKAAHRHEQICEEYRKVEAEYGHKYGRRGLVEKTCERLRRNRRSRERGFSSGTISKITKDL